MLVAFVAVAFLSYAFAQRKEAAKGDNWVVYAEPYNNGGLKVTAQVVGAFTQKEDFDAAAGQAMAAVKNLFSGKYILRKENQRLYSAGVASQPSGNPLRDTKEYLLIPRGQNGPNGPNGQRNGPPNRRNGPGPSRPPIPNYR